MATAEKAALEAELATLIAANEATPSWGAAVGARAGRIKDIERKLAAAPDDKATARPWIAAIEYSSVFGILIINQQGQRVANTALPDLPKSWDTTRNLADAELIAKAVNSYDSNQALIAELREALQYIADNDIPYLKTLSPGEKGLPGHYGYVAREAISKAESAQ